jgi:hypothetical protein
MTDPYRAPREDETKLAVAEREIVVDGSTSERRTAFARMIAFVGAATVAAIIIVHDAAWAAVVIGASVVVSVWWASRIGARGRVVFSIEQDALVMRRARTSELSIPLHVLDDVELETREIRKVGPDANPIAGLSFNQHVAPAVDVARVVIVRRKESPLRVGEDWISHTEASESFRKLRLFLRSRGWIPRSERRKVK